ncbi:MAG TPA: hypothetical protein PKX87_08635, partial [Alphaproteobacteria bacterium]|nr:hypothetical protein [Alphaproteobacteria bacterium]
MRFPGLAEKKSKEWDPNVPLTAEGGPLDRGSDLRQIAAFFSDGRLFVSRSHIQSPLVLSLMSEVKLSGYPEARVEPVDITRLQMCYESNSPLRVRGRQDDVRMRREVLSLVGELSKRRASDIHVVVG